MKTRTDYFTPAETSVNNKSAVSYKRYILFTFPDGGIFMKKAVSVFLFLAVFLSVFSFTSLAVNESQKYIVVLPEKATETEKLAGETLAKYAGRIAGVEIPVVSRSQQPGAAGYCFYVGDGEAVSSEPDGYYVINPIDNGCEIYGPGDSGTICGVYGFLEKYCGYHCYTPKTGMVSYADRITLPEERTEYSPAFDYTDTDWPASADAEFAYANCVNGRLFRSYVDEPGGSAGYISNFCHTLSTEFCSSEKYFEKNPELFALHDGQRTPNQLCLTNEKTYGIVLDEVMELLKEKHNPDAPLQIISLTQHDNYDYCQCPECAKLDEENGSQSGSILTFVNRIAKEVKNAGYDNVAIDTFAYLYSRKAPSKVVPDDNVIIRLCTIECCFSHALNDTSCTQNAALKQDLESWNKICSNIYIWDYTTDYSCYCGIFPDFDVLQKNMQFFKEHGVRGVFEEGDAQSDERQVEFGELRAYLLSRLMRDPYCDFEAETDGFVNSYYGKGGSKIKEFIHRIDKNAAGRHAEIFMGMTSIFDFTPDETAELDKLWEEAKLLSAGDDTALKNITESEISWRYVKSSLKLGEYKNLFSRFHANSELYRDIAAHNSDFNIHGNDIPLKHIFKLYPAEKWMDGNKQALVLYIPAIIMYAVLIFECLLIFIFAIKKKKFSYLVHLPLLAGFVEALMWSRRAFLAWRTVDEYCITLGIFFLVAGYVFVQKNRSVCTSKTRIITRSLIDLLIFFAVYSLPLIIIRKQLSPDDTNSDFALVTAYTLCSVFLLYAVTVTCKNVIKKSPGNTDG